MKRLEQPARKAALGLAALAVLGCGVLFGLRLAGVVSFQRPFLGGTTGLEEEALFSVWKALNGQSIYTDAFSAPFSTSYFNWLFYWTYAGWGWLWAPVWHGDEAWLPTIWRLLSLLFSLGAGFLIWRLLRRQLKPDDWGTSLTLFCLAGVCVLNPLFNWMSFSVRPDIGAVFFEIVGFALLTQTAAHPSVKWTALAGLAGAVAWGFKQNHVSMFAGGFLFLAGCRRWRELAAFAAPLVLLAPATVFLTGKWYYQNTVELHALASQFYLAKGIKLAILASLKAPLMLAGLLILVPVALHWRSVSAPLRLAAITTACSFTLSVLGSSKVGAADNYYLSSSLFASVFAVAGVLWLVGQASRFSRLAVVAGLVGLLGQIASVGLVLTGIQGRVNIREDEALAVKLRERLALEQGPVLITGRQYNLPWLHQGRPAFVFSYMYPSYELTFPERLSVREGIRPLVRARYFRIVVDVPWPALDLQQELAAAYEIAEDAGEYRIYRPKQN